MRSIILLLLVTATSCLSAQQLLFDKTIPEQNVPTASRLKNEMRSHYLDSRYVNQKDFLVQQDFLIAISPNVMTLTQLNISKLPASFYLLSVNDGKGTKAAKFVEE